MSKPDGGSLKNHYDPEGLRCAVEENGNISRFIFDRDRVSVELDAAGQLKSRHTWGHELVTRQSGGQSFYYLHNAHGDVTALTGPAGEIINRYRYDAFGNTVESRGEVCFKVNQKQDRWEFTFQISTSDRVVLLIDNINLKQHR